MRGDGACSAATLRRIACAVSAKAATPSGVGVSPAANRRLEYCSAAEVTWMISGTSAIASAPFIVWIARSSSSLTGTGSTCAFCNQ